MEKPNFSERAQEFIKQEYPEFENIENMTLEELKDFREKVRMGREEHALLDFAYKTCANAGYGSSGNPGFYFYDPDVAADITGECRALTQYMWEIIPKFLQEDIWERKDIWELCEFALDESKHDWYRTQVISHQSDTDSTYTSYEGFFKCMTPEYQEKYSTDEAKVNWILNFYKKFMDGQQSRWCEELYNPRHGKNVHEFELELICKSTIGLAKKKYVKGVAYEKGHFMIDNPKLKSTGVEIVRTTTPPLCRKFLKEIVDMLLYEYDSNKLEEFVLVFNQKLKEYYNQFCNAPIDDISQSVGVGDYKKYVIDDKETLQFTKGCPFSVKAAGLYNHLAYKNGRADLQLKSGKIKYYNIRMGAKGEIGYFGFPSEECPDFAPKIDYQTQWAKTIIEPVNRFLSAIKIPNIDSTNQISFGLFDLM